MSGYAEYQQLTPASTPGDMTAARSPPVIYWLNASWGITSVSGNFVYKSATGVKITEQKLYNASKDAQRIVGSRRGHRRTLEMSCIK
ncbi:hypothetical protein PG988_002233 [Apiospora saccharicola]